MANGTDLIEPLAGAPAPVEIAPTDPQSTPAEGGDDLPDAILQIPAFGPLMTGAPGAASIKIADMAKTEEGKAIAANANPLQAAGFFFYRALDKSTGVIGNGLFVTPEQIQQADAAGQLAQVAPPFEMLNSEAAKAGELNPVLNAQTPPGPPTAPAPMPPQQSSGLLNPPPASVQKSLAGARAKNLQPGKPTDGPVPGRGRLLSNLLKPAI